LFPTPQGFVSFPSKHGQLVSEPFRSWKKAPEKFDEHFLKKRHNSGDTSVKKKPGSKQKAPSLSKQVHGTLIATVIEKIYLFSQNLFVEICNQFVDSVNFLKHHIVLRQQEV
jgi:hypothetical protein